MDQAPAQAEPTTGSDLAPVDTTAHHTNPTDFPPVAPRAAADDGQVESASAAAEPEAAAAAAAAGTIERQAEEDEIIAEQFSNEYHDSEQAYKPRVSREVTADAILTTYHSSG